MARILFFDDRGYLYFKERDDLTYMRDGIVKAVKDNLDLYFPDDTELVLYSLHDKSLDPSVAVHNTAYMQSSVDGTKIDNDWIVGIGDLFKDNDLVICDYNWNTASGEYSDAREKIISAVLHSGKIVYFILYSAVKATEADEYYINITKNSYPSNIHLAREAATFNEDRESMHYTLTRKMKKMFKK